MIADGNAAYHLVARFELNTKSPAHHVKLSEKLSAHCSSPARPTTDVVRFLGHHEGSAVGAVYEAASASHRRCCWCGLPGLAQPRSTC